MGSFSTTWGSQGGAHELRSDLAEGGACGEGRWGVDFVDEATITGRREVERGCSQKCFSFLFYSVDAFARPKVSVGARPRWLLFGTPPPTRSGVLTSTWLSDLARTAPGVREPTGPRRCVVQAGATQQSTARTPEDRQSALKLPLASAALEGTRLRQYLLSVHVDCGLEASE